MSKQRDASYLVGSDVDNGPGPLMKHPSEWDQSKVQAMRAQVKELLADALRVADETRVESKRVAEQTRVETERVAHAVHVEAARIAEETRVETERVAEATRVETERVAEATRFETARVQHVHDDQLSASENVHRDEVAAEQHVHDDQMRNLDLALASRDVLGQAKGIIMVTMHCDADEAFRLIRAQSQAENRKAVEIAAEIVGRVSRRASV